MYTHVFLLFNRMIAEMMIQRMGWVLDSDGMPLGLHGRWDSGRRCESHCRKSTLERAVPSTNEYLRVARHVSRYYCMFC